MNPQNDQKSLRDEFAMAALTGLIANGKTDPEEYTYEFIAMVAYKFADRMLAERKK